MQDSSITIVMAADDNFAVGLAGTVRSLIACHTDSRSIRLFVLDGGISAGNKTKLESLWSHERFAVEWLPVNRQLVSEFVVSDHVTDATYYRLLAPEILPGDVHRFIYLDADLLVRRDIAELWDSATPGCPCLAIQDLGAPFVDSREALPSQHGALGHLVNERPIENYRDLGLDPTSPYFNGGVLLVDLRIWRREGLAKQMLDVLTANQPFVKYWDQYALNVVLSSRWQPLDPRWNQNAHIFRLGSWEESILPKNAQASYVGDPWIVHFNWIKPWQEGCDHPFAKEFQDFLKQSPWEIKVPPPPGFLQQRLSETLSGIRRQLKSYEKQIRGVFRPLRRRKAA